MSMVEVLAYTALTVAVGVLVGMKMAQVSGCWL
jgi:hypothetical protein